MSQIKWTEEQYNAISARTGALLVSAAAGSGKTAVLAERVISLMTDRKNPVLADRLLVVTFSNAAAAEMKERISDRLSDLIQERPRDELLLEQQLLLQNAKICTVHSFCLDLVRENSHLLDLSVGFRVGGEKELAIMRQDALKIALEEAYKRASPDFTELLELAFSGADDRRLGAAVLGMYDFLRAHPFYGDWIKEKLLYYDPEIPVGSSVWGQMLLEYAREVIDYAICLSKDALDIIIKDRDMSVAYLDAYMGDAAQLEELRSAVMAKDWDLIREKLRKFRFLRLGALRGYDDVAKKDSVASKRTVIKDIISELKDKRFCSTSEQYLEDVADLRPKIGVFFGLVMDFEKLYENLKKEREIVDFNDLEHLALNVLVEKADGIVKKTRSSYDISSLYDHILVDEYQDTNEAQDLIFRALSRDERNIFMVGDVKQSIYRFRQAMPEIFIEKKDLFEHYNGEAKPSKIMLSRNFRSCHEVTAFINFLFSKMMSRRLGDVDYDKDEQLVSEPPYPDLPGRGCELHLVSATGRADNRTHMEARYIAEMVKKMLDEGRMVIKGRIPKKIEAGDICLLMRSPVKKAALYQRELAAVGIGARADSDGTFLHSREITVVMSLLRTLDNPLLDIPLTTSLLSPIFGFLPDDIARLRLSDGNKPLYLCLSDAAKMHDELCLRAMSKLDIMRGLAASLPADRLLRRVYEITGYLNMSLTMENGEQRRANLRLLIDYAADYQKFARDGLSGFVRYIDRILERGDDLTPAPVSRVSNAVRIMSIHGAKGLEFPVVILCDTAKQFNRDELKRNMLYGSALGFGCARRDTATQNSFTTVPLEALRIDAEQSMLSEEMRILYVAMTRARERLIIACTRQEPSKKLKALARYARKGENILPYAARQADCYADWLLMSIMGNSRSSVLLDMPDEVTEKIEYDLGAIKLIASPSPDMGRTEPLKNEYISDVDIETLRRIERNASWVYPFECETRLPVKLSVTDLVAPKEHARMSAKRPAFLACEGLSAAQQGTAMHLFLLHADFDKAKEDLDCEIGRLVDRKFITRAQSGALNKKQIADFLQSGLARRIMWSPRVERERSFIAELGGERLNSLLPDIGDRKVAIQGIADLVFEEEGALIIVDYKTDRVSSARELYDRYALQLQLYAEILSRVMGKPVQQAIIYSLCLGLEIQVEPAIV